MKNRCVGKELDKMFFHTFYDLLEQYIDPISEKLSNKIQKTTENICRSKGYYWEERCALSDYSNVCV